MNSIIAQYAILGAILGAVSLALMGATLLQAQVNAPNAGLVLVVTSTPEHLDQDPDLSRQIVGLTHAPFSRLMDLSSDSFAVARNAGAWAILPAGQLAFLCQTRPSINLEG